MGKYGSGKRVFWHYSCSEVVIEIKKHRKLSRLKILKKLSDF